MNTKEDLIVSRVYQKGDQFQSRFIREVSGGDIDGSVFQFETWKNNIEDRDLRLTSGDIYYVRSRYFAKLLNLLEEGWKKQNVGVHGNKNRDFFNPEAL
jgi:hypothetical protein